MIIRFIKFNNYVKNDNCLYVKIILIKRVMHYFENDEINLILYE